MVLWQAAEPSAATPETAGVTLLLALTAMAGALGLFAVLAGRVRPATLALGFAGTAVQWGLAYVAMIGVGLWLGEALFVLTLLVPVGVGWVAARHAANQSSPWAAGLVNGLVNLLIVGSVVGGKDTQAALLEAAVWSGGLVVGSGLLAAVGGRLGRGASPGAVLPPPTSLFAMVTAATIFLLLMTGGLVTGLEAGLAVPDWPNSFGHNMLLYPVSEMKGGVYYEHAHRLLGMLVGLTTFTLTAVCWRHERRAGVRGLAVALLAMVCVQGLMGGLRVTGSLTLEQDPGLLQPSTALAIAHGVFGQLVFAAAAAIAALTSARWLGPASPLSLRGAEGVRLWSTLAPCVLLGQLFLGAAYRHLQVSPQSAEEAIRHPTWAMHGHLGFSIVAIIAVLIAAGRLSAAGREHAWARPMALSGQAMVALVVVQVGLGFVALAAVLMRRGVTIPAWELLSTSAHQATGALLLMASVQGALWSRRLVAAPAPVPALSSSAASA